MLSIGGISIRRISALPTLLELLELPAIESILLKGKGSFVLGGKTLPFLEALKDNQRVRVLDISYNRIGDRELAQLAVLVLENGSLNELYVDGSKPARPGAFCEFLEAICEEQNDRIHTCPFPMEDRYELVQSMAVRSASKCSAGSRRSRRTHRTG
jgi:hypothetical protein